MYDTDYTLASYALLRAGLQPNFKIVVTAPTFRGTKIIGCYIERIFEESLFDVIGKPSEGMVKQEDYWTMYVGDGTITFLPLQRVDAIAELEPDCIIVVDRGLDDVDDYDVILTEFTKSAPIGTNIVPYTQFSDVTILEKL